MNDLLEALLEGVDTTLTAENATKLVESKDAPALHESLTNSYVTMASTVDKFLNENTTDNLAVFNAKIQPLLRRVFPTLIATQITSVQPVNNPNGQIFALRGRDDNGTEIGFGLPSKGLSGPRATKNAERASDAKGVKVGIEVMSVQTVERLLKSAFTPELVQDMKNVFGVDAKKVIMDFLAVEMGLELDREVIDLYKTDAISVDAGTVTLPTDSYQKLGKPSEAIILDKILSAQNMIAQMTMKGRGNFVIAPGSVITALQSMNAFQEYKAEANVAHPENAVKTFVGTLRNGLKVYQDWFATDETVVVGYKGASALDAGLIYSPYTTWFDEAIDASTFERVVGLKNRYALTPNTAIKGYAVRFVVNLGTYWDKQEDIMDATVEDNKADKAAVADKKVKTKA